MPADLQKARELFLHAVGKLAPEEWDGYVGQACAGDVELKQQVGQLLQVHREAGSFLDQPAAAVGATAAYPPAPGEDTTAAPVRERSGTVIGPYKLLQQIGEGGMGTVFMAEQTQPVQRKVALKVIKAGMDSAQVVARFEAERQALAVMDHVNIARVLDVGTTESGRPYFVMELVHGVPITKYCDDNRLTPRERLELFVPVCQAIQHAHQKGIIHRDIKPSNVMITLYDGKPVPKVIDFGVAKAIEQRLTERTLFTQYGTMVGTLEYMSPEQAEMSALGVDTRSDIYSLGVLLYELLTGSTPLSHKRVREVALAELLRLIKEEEPPRPSTRLSASGAALASISAQRHMEPAKLAKLVRGELDWIVMKCLEKDRNRRYETANGFAADVQRYLNDETVQACPPSANYRLRKLVRRNKGPVLAASLVSLALVGGMLGTTWGLVQALHQRDVAEDATKEEAAQRRQAVAQKDRATTAEALANKRLAEVTRQKQRTEEEAAISRSLNAFLQNDLLGQADIGNQPGGASAVASVPRDPDVKVRTLLDRAAKEIEGKFADQPLTESAIRLTLGETYKGLAQYDESKRHLERSIQLRVANLEADHPDTLTSKNNLADLYLILGKYDQAETIFREVLAARTAKLGPDHSDTLTSKNDLATLYQAQGRYDRAEDMYKEVLAVQTAKQGADHLDTLTSKNNLAALYQSMAKYDGAETILKEVLDVRTAKQGADHPDMLTSKNNLAKLYQALAEYDQAETLYKEVIEASTATRGSEHPSTLLSKGNLAALYQAQGKYKLAESLFRLVVDAFTAKFGADHPGTMTSKNNLATLYLEQGKYERAETIYQEVLDTCTAKLGADHPDTLNSKHNLAGLYLSQGKFDLAEPICKEVFGAYTVKFGADNPYTLVSKNNLAGLYQGQRKYDLAESLFTEVVKASTARLGADHPHTLSSKSNLAGLYREQGKYDKAEDVCNQVIEAFTTKLGADHPYTLASKNTLATVYAGQGKYDRAETLYKNVLGAQTTKLGANHPDTLGSKNNLAVLYGQQGKFDLAEPFSREALEGARKKLGFSHPRTQANLRTLAHCYEKLGKPAEAEALLCEAIKFWEKQSEAAANEPSDRDQLARSHHELAALLWENRKLSDAEKEYRRTIAIWEKLGEDVPLQPEYRVLAGALYAYRLAPLLEERGQPQQVEEALRRSVAIFEKLADEFPGEAGQQSRLTACHLKLAIFLDVGGQYQEAERAYSKILERAPKNAATLNNLAWLLANCPDPTFRDPGRALKAAKQAVDLAPTNKSYWLVLGVAHYRSGDWQASLVTLEKSMELRKGGDSYDWFFLAMAHWKLGHKEEAGKWYDQAVKSMDKNPNEKNLRRIRAEAAALLEKEPESRSQQSWDTPESPKSVK